jgi:hypothetical protein
MQSPSIAVFFFLTTRQERLCAGPGKPQALRLVYPYGPFQSQAFETLDSAATAEQQYAINSDQ